MTRSLAGSSQPSVARGGDVSGLPVCGQCPFWSLWPGPGAHSHEGGLGAGERGGLGHGAWPWRMFAPQQTPRTPVGALHPGVCTAMVPQAAVPGLSFCRWRVCQAEFLERGSKGLLSFGGHSLGPRFRAPHQPPISYETLIPDSRGSAFPRCLPPLSCCPPTLNATLQSLRRAAV